MNNSIFVYEHKTTKEIRVEYIEKAKSLADDPDWFHNATLEPRAYLESVFKRHPCLIKEMRKHFEEDNN